MTIQAKKLRAAVVGAALAAGLMAGGAHAETVKIGVIAPFSGPFALVGQTFRQGIGAYVAEHGDQVAGNKIEFIYKDLDQINPAQSKALAQELIVKDKVAYLAGFYFTPDALAVAPLIDEAKIPTVIFNAATSAINEKSAYFLRSSFTLWQTSAPLGRYVYEQGVRKVATAVSDYGPGIDGETAFKTTFEKAGGQVVESLRMPVKSADFAPFMQRIKDSGAQAIYAFLPSGPPTAGFVKAFTENGLRDKGVKFYATGDLTQETDLPVLGDAALGMITSYHYSAAHDSALNRAFIAKQKELFGPEAPITFTAVGAYDGTHLIYEMVKATGGKADGAKALEAAKKLSWESPRGPLRMDPETRTVIQNIYIREVAKVDGVLINKEIATLPDQVDPGYKLAK